jgi:protein O-mannosyl-transferase
MKKHKKMSLHAWQASLSLGVIMLALWLYWPALANHFLYTWDDNVYVIHNPYLALTADNFARILTVLYPSNWHPLTLVSHAIDATLFGLEAYWHRLGNLILHSMNSLWLFWVSLALLNAAHKRPLLQPHPHTLVAATISAVLFALHPQHVEAVVWIAQRKEVLSAFFLLPALLAYLLYTHAHRKSAQYYWFILALLCYTAAVLAKPMAVSFPLLLLLLDIYPLRRFLSTAAPSFRQIALEKLPFALLAAGVIGMTLLAQQAAIQSLHHITLEMRILNAFNSSIFYIQKFLLPLHLSPYYEYSPYRSLSANYAALLPVGGFIALTALALWAWQRGLRYWLLAWGFYLISLTPVIGIVQVGIQAAADRYAYIPTLPAYWLVGAGMAYTFFILSRRISRIALAAAVVMVLSVVAGLTRAQINVWHTDKILWTQVLSVTPNNPTAQCGLAETYLSTGAYDKALEYYRKSLDQIMMPYCFYHFGLNYLFLGETEGMRQVFETILHNKMPMDKQKLANIHAQLALFYAAHDQIPSAISHAHKALTHHPTHPQAKQLHALLD